MKYLLSVLIALFVATGAYAQCNPSFTVIAVAPNGNDLLPVTATNTTVYTPPAGYAVNYSFDFGGAGYYSVEGFNYSSPGTYTVTMTMVVTDSPGNATYCSNTATEQVTVAYTPCATSMSYSVSSNSASGEVVNFTTLNPAATNDLTYSWNYGDGSAAGTGPTPQHTYTTNGNYTVTLTTTSASNGCTYVNTTYVNIALFDCASLVASFTYTTSYSSVSLNASSSSDSLINSGSSISWSYGDGTSGSNSYHDYGLAGSFTVTLTETWIDPATGETCTHTATQQVTVGNPAPPPSTISGNVLFNSGAIILDSSNYTNIKVWLIQYDATTNILSAIDSTYAYGNGLGTTFTYEFYNVPAGSFRTKAAIIGNQTAGTAGYVPTYHTSSQYWSGATVINHTANTSDVSEDIDMIYGTVVSGPGFIAGDVTTGANKNTNDGDPVPDMLIFLRDEATNTVVASTTTATDGTYSFSNLPVGTYNVYPEQMNYATTYFDNVVLTAAQPSATSKKFRQHTVSMTITPITSTGVANVTSKESKISIYPNPSNGQVTISWQPSNVMVSSSNHAHVAVSDVSGRAVYETNIEMSAGQKQISITGIADGLYTISVKSENINYTQKLVLQH